MITAGEGKYKVWLKKEELSGDLIYILGGGERSHVGSVILKVPGKDVETIRIEGHYDHLVLQPLAVEASAKYNRKVVAVGGVHVDNATEEEIALLVSNCKELVDCI